MTTTLEFKDLPVDEMRPLYEKTVFVMLAF